MGKDTAARNRIAPLRRICNPSGNDYKDLQSDNDNGIANADIQHDGITNPVEQFADGATERINGKRFKHK